MSAIQTPQELETLCTCLSSEAQYQSLQMILALNASPGALAAERAALARLVDFAEHVQHRLDESSHTRVLDPCGAVGALLDEAAGRLRRNHQGLVAAHKVVLADAQLAWPARKRWFEEIVRAETEHEVLLATLDGVAYLVRDHDVGVAVAVDPDGVEWRQARTVLARF